MAVVQLADVLKSAVEYLKTIPEITAIVSTAAGWTSGSGARISGALGSNWKVPTQAIVIRRAGGSGMRYDGWHVTRLDVWCYGANALEAVNLWRWVHPALCPDQSGVAGWAAANCRVGNVTQEADPIPADDLDVNWPVLITPYSVTWKDAPV